MKNIYKSKLDYLLKIVNSFSLSEKTVFIILGIILTITSLSLFWQANLHFTSIVPNKGGSLVEGMIGGANRINPLLELSDTDRDLTYLIYSGLMKATAEGDLIPDLAESYNISGDGLTYTFRLKDNIYFHDGEKVTADDIIYTIETVQDAALRSPKRNSWIGVQAEKVSDIEITFNLKQPYSPFLENTTLGILPKHIWGGATVDEFSLSSYNTEPIGSGPYKIDKINRNKLGIPTSYELKAFADYSLGEPFITKLKLVFFPNEKDLADAFLAQKIDSTSSLSPQNLSITKKKENTQAKNISLPRIFGLFFNQNQAEVFLNKEVRTALNMTVDRERIVSEVLNGYGHEINSPLPLGTLTKANSEEKSFNKTEALEGAKKILEKAGWKLNEETKILEKKINKTKTQKLTFSISTANTTDLKRTAEILKEDWASLGAQVEVLTFDPSDLNQSVISQRNYESLLFGEIINRSLDLFAFWHSSQRNTGYNVAMYTNSKADKLLEEARQITDKDMRLKKYAQFEIEIQNDIPAIFIYSPEFIYLLPSKVRGFASGLINNRSERFEEVHRWYIETDRVWNFLTKI